MGRLILFIVWLIVVWVVNRLAKKKMPSLPEEEQELTSLFSEDTYPVKTLLSEEKKILSEPEKPQVAPSLKTKRKEEIPLPTIKEEEEPYWGRETFKQGIILSEILLPPLAKRLHQRRRML